MKRAFLLIFSCCGYLIAQAQLPLPEVRRLYLEAVEDAQKSDEFLKYMQRYDQSEPIAQAYMASALALKSKHISGPAEKLKYLRSADQAFEEAVGKNPDDAEVRFLRFSVQHNIPKFLGFSDDIRQDIVVMLNTFRFTRSLTSHSEWKQTVIEFMLNSGQCSDEEQSRFKALLVP